jgi:hypothetical protein
VGQYNRWLPADLRSNFIMSLDGVALKWFRCIDSPTTWFDVAAQAGTGGGDGTQAQEGLRTAFLREFQQESYTFFQKKKLRSRVQGTDELVTAYYYDVLDLCRIVDPTMTEAKTRKPLSGTRHWPPQKGLPGETAQLRRVPHGGKASFRGYRNGGSAEEGRRYDLEHWQERGGGRQIQ